MDTMRPDERAAGVISGTDPYRELELYLEKVNEEIGEVFDRWKTADHKKQTPPSPAIPIPVSGSKGSSARCRGYSPEKRSTPQPPQRRRNKSKKLCNGERTKANHNRDDEKSASVFPSGNEVVPESRSLPSRGKWTHSARRGETLLSPRVSPEKRKVSVVNDYSITEWSEGLLAEFNSIIANELSQLQSVGGYTNGHIATNHVENCTTKVKNDIDNSRESAMRLRITRSRSWDSHHVNDSDSSSPGRGTPPMSPATSPSASETSSGSGANLHQKAMGLARVLRKHRAQYANPDLGSSASGEAVLVRVASLPDPELLRLSDKDIPISRTFDLHKKPPRKDHSCTSPLSKSSGERNDKQKAGNKLPPPKEKSHSDEHLLHNGNGQTSASSNYMLTELLYADGGRNPSALCKDRQLVDSCVSTDDNPWAVDADEESSSPGRTGSNVIPVALQSFLTRIRPRRSSSSSPSRCASPCIGSGACCARPVDAGTQTSPALSRSSSFTWVSDCSSSFLLEDEGSTTSSSSSEGCRPDYVSSRDSLSDSPEGSAGTPEREEPESGIGTASPPRTKAAHTVCGSNKARRKETWERLRRRQMEKHMPFGEQEVWIRRENVETQTASAANTTISSTTEVDSDAGTDETPSPVAAHSLPLSRPRAARPHCLPIKPHHIRSTPSPVAMDKEDQRQASPSTASLKLNNAPLVAELGNKSSSAPLLVKQAMSPGGTGDKPEDSAKKRVLAQPRSQSERHLAEIEAAEACKWLRAAGFPQYAQMYEDLQFPIDVSGVQKDHPFLDPDSLQSLFRRLHALNRCAKMKVDNLPKNKADDSDEDDNCALSENWTFQPESRRWSRVCDVTAQHAERLQALSASSQASQEKPAEEEPEFPGDRLMDPGDEDEEEEDYDPEGIPVISSFRYGSLPPGSLTPGDSEMLAVRFRRTGSERLRDGAKALLRRMESLKSRRRKRQHREGIVISGPQVLDVMTMQQRMKDLNCVDVSPTSMSPELPPTGLPTPSSPSSIAAPCTPLADDNSDGSSTTPPNPRNRSKNCRSRRLLRRGEDVGALSDSEVQPTSWRHQYFKDANSNHTKVLEFVDGRSRGSQDQEPARRASGSSKSQARAGSLNLGKDSQRYRDKLQQAFHKEVTVYRDKSGSSELMGSQESSSTLASQADSDHDDTEVTPRHKAVVVRWHSFQRGSNRPDSCLFRPPDSGPLPGSRPMGALSCGQLLVLRKLALLKLTACMERYCPTHRTGWNWELPKFIRKIKAPDYKDKTVFGVPLLLSLQRNGQALPKCIQAALRWLRVNALDQVGIFRKSGVRSRIQKLKLMTESQGESISYEGQQAYDVADMVKQYFRELPEALLTNKLSETFIAIFQHVPTNLRQEAVQCVLLLLPDEHREALQTLLEFLHQVSARSACNQMTSSNLAVCLAPSLFHLHHTPSASSRSASASPRRRKTVGVPDPRELNENKAAHDCLLYLIREHKDLFVVPEEMLAQCHFNYMEESIPVALEELGSEFQQDWRGYLYACTTALLKEAREKSRGWVSMSCSTDQQVEMAYKKVGDGHPLRLWRVSTEVEAPPQELLQRVLRERHIWDYSLLKWRVVARLDPQVEVFQYVCANMAPLSAKDYCVLRSWRTDLPKGACVIVETSVEHPDAPVMLGGVRGIVLASRYLIEPCGSGKSRIMHLSRVDTKGRTPEWYNKSYGHICALYLTRIRTSFKHNTDGPESKV